MIQWKAFALGAWTMACTACAPAGPSKAEVEAALKDYWELPGEWRFPPVETALLATAKLERVESCSALGASYICDVTMRDIDDALIAAQVDMIPTHTPSKWVTSGPQPRP